MTRDPLLLTALLCIAALARTGCMPAPDGGFEALTRESPPVPDLARDGAERLAWMPGVGVGRARRIVEQRPYLPRAVDVESLPRLPGVGEVTAAEVERWLDSLAEDAASARE